MIGNVITFFGGFKALVCSQVTCATGVVLQAKGRRHENQRMVDLFGDGWDKEWYNYYDIQAGDPLVRASNIQLILPGRILIFLGSITITGGWSVTVLVVTLIFSILLLVSELWLKDPITKKCAAWAKAKAEADMFKESNPSTGRQVVDVPP